MITSTCNTIPAGYAVIDVQGVVYGDAVARFNAPLSEQSRVLEDLINDCRIQAFEKILSMAREVGANAVLGAAFQITPTSQTGRPGNGLRNRNRCPA